MAAPPPGACERNCRIFDSLAHDIGLAATFSGSPDKEPADFIQQSSVEIVHENVVAPLGFFQTHSTLIDYGHFSGFPIGVERMVIEGFVAFFPGHIITTRQDFVARATFSTTSTMKRTAPLTIASISSCAVASSRAALRICAADCSGLRSEILCRL